MTTHVSRRWSRAQAIATVAAVAIGSVVLFFAAAEEPYHIDELRQVSAYANDIGEVAQLSIEQEQPPLDAVLNAVAQRSIGVGDVQQRLLSVLFGIGSLALIGALTMRNSFGWGSPVAVLAMALSPLLVSVTAYARPYALPLFLILALVLSIDIWLDRPGFGTGPLIVAISLLLPLSRTVEPNLALAGIVVVLILGRYVFGAVWRGTIWVPAGAALAALAFVGVPMIARLRSNLADYTQPAPLWTKLDRLVADLPLALADVIPWWPIVIPAILAAVAFGPSRKRLAGLWWFWVLVIVPVGFAAVFFYQARVSIPYFSRYAFSWWPPLAVALGALTSSASVASRQPSGCDEIDESADKGVRPPHVVALAIMLITLLGFGLALRDDLSTAGRADWAAASEAIERSTSDETAVIFEHALPIGAYRSQFFGQPRYLDPSRSVMHTGRLIRNPTQVGESQPIALLLEGADPEIPGFSRHRIDSHFALYVPNEPLVGPTGASAALVAVAVSLSPTTGSHAALTAAAILAGSGELQQACEVVESFDLLTGEREARVRQEVTRAGEFGMWISECAVAAETAS